MYSEGGNQAKKNLPPKTPLLFELISGILKNLKTDLIVY